MRGRRQGSTMAVTLMSIGLVAVLAFCAVSASITCLDVSVGLDVQQRCRNLAESALGQALDMVLASSAWESKTPTITTPPAADGSLGVVTFSHSLVMQGRPIPWSTDNSASSASAPGYNNETVPLQCVDLIGTGLSHGHMASIEAVLQLPLFPYAIATSGTFASTGSLVVGDVLNVGDATSYSQLLPGDVVSNSPATLSMHLQGAAMIKGDALSAGGIQTDPSVILGGRLRPYGNPVVIPSLPFTPPVNPTNVATVPNPANSPELVGFNSSGPLTVNGDLTLDGAVLQVNGDLTVNGAVKGWGAVYVSGNTVLNGGASLRTEDLTALLSQGDLTIQGGGQSSSYFTGVIYTEGDFHASDITLIGAFMANQGSGQVGAPGSTMTMSNVDAILVQGLSNVQFTVTTVPASILDQPLPPITSINYTGMPSGAPGTLVPVQLNSQGVTARMAGMDDHGNIPASDLTDSALNNLLRWNGVSNAQSLSTWMAMWPPQMAPPPYPSGYTTAAYDEASAWLQKNQQTLYGELRQVLAQVQQQVWNQMAGLIDDKVNGGTIFRLDLSKFFNPYDRLHLVVWRELP